MKMKYPHCKVLKWVSLLIEQLESKIEDN